MLTAFRRPARQLVRRPRQSHGLRHHFQRMVVRRLDFIHHLEMPHLGIGEDLIDGIDLPTRNACGIQPFDPGCTSVRPEMPLDFRGTVFQKAVWTALLAIPFGETRSYADIARAIGRPTAFRAVGAANGRNPISIVAPCHRVIGTSGALTGFAGGLKAKEILLGLERARLAA